MHKEILIIAEIAQAHDGSIARAHQYIEALAKTGVDSVKFQVHIAEAESSAYEPFRVQLSSADKTRYDYWKRMEFTKTEWKALKKHCNDLGVEFLASPFSNAAVDLLEQLGVKRYKVGSGEVSNWLMLEKIAQTGKPLILSTGMSSWEELDKTVSFLKNRKVDFSILQCTTAYPTQPEQYGLNMISELKKRYQITVGYSDHSAKVETCIAAAALGAEILEFHAVFDQNEIGPDATSSLTIDEITVLVKGVRNIKTALDNPVNKNSIEQYQELKTMFGKSLAVNKTLPKGHILAFNDLEAKKPAGYGIPAQQFQRLIGMKLGVDKNQWDFLKEEDVSSISID
ncbi:MAG: N-acetylneuraminate synthase family protein [Bacteroidetes bacterium]|nr:N-acetylneuraminate synthase family protein [Bacteroidota bacterium]